MRLFHVSEESDINIFYPRIPTRNDIDNSTALVWAINEKCLPNFLTPRNCPRVTYHVGNSTTTQDIDRFISSRSINHVVAIEHDWFYRLKNTTLYIYEFNPEQFKLQDDIAGYYVSSVPQKPIAKHIANDLLIELFQRNIELRIIDDLWDLCENIKKSSFDWSMCRMAFAKHR